MNRLSIASVLAFFLGATSCASNEPPAKAPEPPPSPVSTSAAPAAPTVQETHREGASTLAASSAGANTETTPSGPTSESSTSPKLTDDQILYVLHAANLAEMDQARMAQKKAKNARVKRFADAMLKDHGEADGHGNDVAKKVQASLAPSQTSNRLEGDAKLLTTNIAAEKEKNFDRTYMDAQVKEHRAVLDAIDRELLPAVRSADVKDLVQSVRTKVQGHLQEAEQIQKGLSDK